MLIYLLLFLMLVFLELICSFMLLFNVKNIEKFTLILLILNMFVVFLSSSTQISFFYNLIYNNFIFNIIYLIVNFILILGYFGLDDNLKSLHRFSILIFYILNIVGLLIIFF